MIRELNVEGLIDCLDASVSPLIIIYSKPYSYIFVVPICLSFVEYENTASLLLCLIV